MPWSVLFDLVAFIQGRQAPVGRLSPIVVIPIALQVHPIYLLGIGVPKRIFLAFLAPSDPAMSMGLA